jgi:hypothetical protein
MINFPFRNKTVIGFYKFGVAKQHYCQFLYGSYSFILKPVTTN